MIQSTWIRSCTHSKTTVAVGRLRLMPEVQEALLSQRGRAMLRACLSVVSFNSTIPRAYSLLLLVTSASELPMRTIKFLPRDAYAQRGLCRGKMSVRLSHAGIVCKRLYISSKFFSTSGSPTILVYSYRTGWQYSDGNPLTGAPNAMRYEKNDFRPSRFISEMMLDRAILLWKANRKPHPSFRMVPVWITLIDL